MTYIRVTSNFNEITILNQCSFVGLLTQIIRGNEYCLSTRLAIIGGLEYTV